MIGKERPRYLKICKTCQKNDYMYAYQEECDECLGKKGPERIKCAAVRKYFLLYEGESHAQIGKDHPGILKNSVQGFVTEDGLFYGRSVALDIAKEAGQIVKKHGNSKLLFSEDLKE